MGYIFDFNDARAYEKWFYNPHNRFAACLESRLMLDMLKPMYGETLLDIGCGVGANFKHLLNMGLKVTGIDPSPYMLDIALKNAGNRAELYRGFAEDLPFDDNSFNHACFLTTLEFVEDPQKAIEEAFRVAKDRVFLGVLNRYAIKGIQRRVKGVFTKSIYNHAKFFGIWELKQMIRNLLGDVPISWRTVCQLPTASGKIVHKIEMSSLVQKCPFGAFIGILVSIVPRFRTRPLAIKYQAEQTTSIATG